MGSYEVAKLILAGLIILLGLVMVIFPKACTKAENRDNPDAVAKVRKSGILEMVIGVLLLVLFLIQ